MSLLQVLQVKALKDLHEVGHDLAVLHEPRCCEGPRASSDEGDRTVSGSCDVHASGPGEPSLAVSSQHEGA